MPFFHTTLTITGEQGNDASQDGLLMIGVDISKSQHSACFGTKDDLVKTEFRVVGSGHGNLLDFIMFNAGKRHFQVLFRFFYRQNQQRGEIL